MSTQERQLYASENGDRWSLARDPDDGRVFVRHRPNLPSGGQVSDTSLGEFLVQGGLGPEKQELLRLIGSLLDSAEVNGSELQNPEPQGQPADQTGPDIPRSNAMPKGQQKSNKEIKKPKKEKPSAAPAPSFEKGLNPSNGTPKKKG